MSDLFFVHEEAALSNPNTTRDGRKRAKMELGMMVRMSDVLLLQLQLIFCSSAGTRRRDTRFIHDQNKAVLGHSQCSSSLPWHHVIEQEILGLLQTHFPPTDLRQYVSI